MKENLEEEEAVVRIWRIRSGKVGKSREVAMIKEETQAGVKVLEQRGGDWIMAQLI